MSGSRQPPTLRKPAKNRAQSASMKTSFTNIPPACQRKFARSAMEVRTAAADWIA